MGENENWQEILTSDVDFCNQESKVKGGVKTLASYGGKESFNKDVNFYVTGFNQILA